MKAVITPTLANGTVAAPPSKSAAHRALIAGALSDGCLVRGVSDSEDMAATLRCLAAMGAHVKKNQEGVYIGGLQPENIPACTLDCGESGSTLRFLIPLCLLCGRPVTLRGRGRLMERPLTEYEELCRKNGFLFEKEGDRLTVCGKLTAGTFELSGARSSQFITGMLYVLPLLAGQSTLRITGAQSRSYIRLTKQVLEDFGICIAEDGMCYTITGVQRYHKSEFAVEGDWSNAAFLDALGELGGSVQVTGLRPDSTQGDKIYKEYFKKLGKEELDLSDCPDLAPVLFALAALRGGEFTGCARLRLKESDRISAMQSELCKCGIFLAATEDRVVIRPEGLHSPACDISGHNDHRIVMAMAVLLSRVGGSIEGVEAVAKSWPDFFKAIRALGIEVELC